MKYLKENYPVFFSPKFHGLVLFMILGYLQAKGLIGGVEFEYLQNLVGLVTGVGVADSLFRKLGK